HLWAPVDRAAGFAAPVDHGFAGWTFDPATTPSTTQPTAGVMSVARVNLGPRMSYPLSTIWVSLSAGGQGLNNCFLGVYTVSADLSTATLAAATADISNLFAGAGEVAAPLTAPANAGGGNPAWVLIGLLVGSASTRPTLRSALAQNVVNVNLTGLAV